MTDLVKAENVILDVDAPDRESALRTITEFAADRDLVADSATVLSDFTAREAQGSTGLMDGIAIPHAKSEGVFRTAVVVAKFAAPVAWDSMDGKPAKLAIALLVPSVESGDAHLKLLANIARTLMDEGTRKSLVASETAEDIASILGSALDS